MMRGIESRHEIDPTQLLRDTRTLGQRFVGFFSVHNKRVNCPGVSGSCLLLFIRSFNINVGCWGSDFSLYLFL